MNIERGVNRLGTVLGVILGIVITAYFSHHVLDTHNYYADLYKQGNIARFRMDLELLDDKLNFIYLPTIKKSAPIILIPFLISLCSMKCLAWSINWIIKGFRDEPKATT